MPLVPPSLSLHGLGADDSATVDLSGRCVGNSYVLICPVGQGATGTVWRGIDRTSGEQVAVKLLHEGLLRQPKLVTRFVQERTILMMVRHENIVGVRDLFSAGESLGLVMDFVAGGSLRDRLRAAGTLPADEAARLLAQVAAGLAEAHALGVVHRDVKPDNILLHGDDRPDVRLTDFGIARVLDAAGLTTPHAVIGTPHYMAPEIISGGDATPAADVYALGVVLYELVAGRTPYAGEPIAVLRAHLDDAPQRPDGLADGVWDVIRSCVDKDPARRPAAAALRDELRELARRTAGIAPLPAPPEPAPVPVSVVPAPRVAGPPRPRPRNGPRSWVWARRGALAVLVVAALGASGFGGYTAWQTRQAGSAAAAPAPPSPPRGGGAAGIRPSASAALGDAPAPAGAPGPAGPTGTAPRTEAAPAGSATTGSPAPPAADVEVPVGPGTGRGSVAFGPWLCGDALTWDVGHPVLARPCHAVGGRVRVQGQVEATPGVQADVELTVRDARSDEVVAGPHTCEGLMFTDFARKHTCGPADLDPPRGGRYVVVLTWTYTGRSLLPGGTARGREFTW